RSLWRMRDARWSSCSSSSTSGTASPSVRWFARSSMRAHNAASRRAPNMPLLPLRPWTARRRVSVAARERRARLGALVARRVEELRDQAVEGVGLALELVAAELLEGAHPHRLPVVSAAPSAPGAAAETTGRRWGWAHGPGPAAGPP